MTADVRARHARADDDPFLLALFESTRAEELAALPLPPAQREAFVRQQHRAQDASYRAHHPHASFEILMLGDDAIGRLYVDRSGAAIHLLDVALLPPFRGRGIGGAIVASLVDEARLAKRPLVLHVDQRNPARALYERAGLRVVAEEGFYLRMELPRESVNGER